MPNGITVRGQKEATELVRRWLDEGWYGSRIEKMGKGYFLAIKGTERYRPLPPKAEPMPVAKREPMPVTLPKALEIPLEEEYEAREHRRIEAGIAPGREIGAIRYAGGLPVRVPKGVAEEIGRKEMSRMIAAQDQLTRLPSEKELLARKAQVQAVIEAEKTALQRIRTEASVDGEKTEAEIMTRPDAQAVQNTIKAQQSVIGNIDEQFSHRKELEKTIASGGAYSPAVRTGIVIASRVGEAVIGFGKGTAEHMMRRQAAGLRAGLAGRAIPIQSRGGQPTIKIATLPTLTQQPKIRIAETGVTPIVETAPARIATSGVIGMERPAIGTMGTPQIEPRPSLSQTEKGFAVESESPLQATPGVTAIPETTTEQKPSSGQDLSRLMDRRFGTHL